MNRATAPFIWPFAAIIGLDVVVAATFAAGSFVFDSRQQLAPGFSFNQLLALLSVGAVLRVMLVRRWGWLLDEYTALVLMTAVVLGLAILPSPAVEYAWRKWYHFVGFGLMGAAWSNTSCESRKGCWQPLLLLGGVGVVLGTTGLAQYLLGGAGGRLSLMGGGPIVFARWVGTGILAFGCWIIMDQRRWWPLALPVLIPLGFGLLFVLLLAGSKGPFIGFLLGVLYLSHGLFPRVRLPVKILVGLSVFASFIGIAYMLEPSILMRFLLNPVAATSQGSWGIRMEWLSEAIRLIKESPWYGLGLGGWSMSMFHADAKIYPHNLVTELLVEVGPAVGATILVAWTWRASIWWRRIDNLAVPGGLALKCLVLYWSVNVLFSGDLTDSRILILLMGFLWATSRSASANQEPAGVVEADSTKSK